MGLPAFYFALFAAVGVLLPYLPAYLASLGLRGSEVASLLSIHSVLMVVVLPLWGFAADWTARPTALLKLACAGAALSFAPLLFLTSFWPLAAVFALYAFFSTPLATLTDAIAGAEAQRLGFDYARVRLWGSVGFVVSTIGFAAHLERGGTLNDVIPVGVGVMIAYTAVAQLLPPARVSLPTPSWQDVGRLLRDPRMRRFLAGTTLHWAAFAPFNLFYTIHLRALGVEPWLLGSGLVLAVGAEVLVMWSFRDLARRLPLLTILSAAAICASVRWALTGSLTSGGWLAAVQLLHGLSFGGFFVGAIGYLEEIVPVPLRATGRALFVAVSFGIGAVVGNSIAGALFDRVGAELALGVAALVALAPPFFFFSAARAASPSLAGGVPR